MRIFDGDDFRFANPAAIQAADEAVSAPAGASSIVPVERQAAIVGVDGAIGGFTPLVEWVAPDLAGAKARDFALSLGPIVVTPDEETPPGVDWERLIAHAAREHAPPSRRPHRRVTRVAIVGAGVMGCATAWALTEAGADVTVYEQFELDNTRGSSHGRSRIFRVAYPDPFWIRFALEAYAGWRELERTSGREAPGHSRAPRARRRSGAHVGACPRRRAAFRIGCSTQARCARSARTLPKGWTCAACPTSRASCSRTAPGTRSSTVRSTYGRTRRIESLDDVDADVVVVTAGAWIGRLVERVDVRVTRETVAYFRFEGPPLPSVVDIGAARRARHVRAPRSRPRPEGRRAPRRRRDRPRRGGRAGPGDRRADRRAGSPSASRASTPSPVDADTCVYTTTPDQTFVLERRGRVVVGSACSGHGFKFAPAVGAAACGLALPHT